MFNHSTFSRAALLAGAALFALGATPAAAQDAGAQPTQDAGTQTDRMENGAQVPPADDTVANGAVSPGAPDASVGSDPSDQNATGGSQDVVVTGSLLRRTSTETPSPVTVLTSETLAKAGITNINDAVRSISADSAGSISTGFQGGFSAGGAAVSLRGLGVSSTLVLIDGLRSANFPLNDDGHNAYVDLNSIPFSIVDRVEVLKDGASSTYGADAIGGVVNIILKKQFTGLAGTIEAGVSQRGDAGRQRANLTAGYGDYDETGFNAYVNAEYQHDGPVAVNDRGFPYNTTDLSSIGGDDNNTGDSSVSASAGTEFASVRRVNQTDPNNPLAGGATASGLYQTLGLDRCTTRIFTVPGASGGTGCAQDLTFKYSQIQPKQERYSFNGRLSYRVSDTVEAYVAGQYAHNEVLTRGLPAAIRATQPFGAAPALASNNPGIVLPVFVCAAGTNCATAADRRLNPNNPFAIEGNAAQIRYRFGDIPSSINRNNEIFRITAGINGTVAETWNFRVEGIYAKDRLRLDNNGSLNVAGLLNAINTGAYNFVNPGLNSQAVRDQISPTRTTRSNSTEAALDASISHSFFDLPGGPLQVLVGGQVRRETLLNRNQNFDLAFYGLTTSSARGKHTVTAGYFEIDAPILKQLEVNASGRYDHYSEGYGRFSPKVGAKFTPIRQVALRGTYSRGFRAPTFAEANASSQFAGFSAFTPPASFQAAHGGTTNPYSLTYNLGTALVGNPDLKPEKSRSFTGGVIFEPVRWLSATVDYYNIKKSEYIVAGALSGAARTAYFSATNLAAAQAAVAAVGPGYSVNTVDAPDPLFPNALPRVLIINAPFTNAGSQKTSGIDVAVTLRAPITDELKFTSRFEGTKIIKFNLDPGDGSGIQRYVGTLGPYELSSGAGTPKYRANWQNTLEYGPYSLSATAYFVSHIKEVAADEGPTNNLSCADNLYSTSDGTGDSFCYIKSFAYVDLNASIAVNDSFTLFGNVGNLLDNKAPIAPASYSGVNYLPTWHFAGVIGRTMRVGANFKF